MQLVEEAGAYAAQQHAPELTRAHFEHVLPTIQQDVRYRIERWRRGQDDSAYRHDDSSSPE